MKILQSLETRLRTVCGVVLVPVIMLVGSMVALALALLGVPAAKVHKAYLAYARLSLGVGATRLEVHGAHHIVPGQAYIVIANHSSNWDIPCILVALRQLAIRFVTKQEIMQIPVLGYALRLTGNVKVTRTRESGDTERLKQVMDRRDPEVSLLFFAEGTRSRDGSLLRFKMGAFATALGYELPILPVAIAGTYAVLPPKIVRLSRGPVAIEVGRPIPVEGLTLDDRAALRDRAHEAVTELRGLARQRLRDQGCDPGGVD